MWSNHFGLKNRGLKTSSAVNLQVWNLREMIPFGKPYWVSVAGLWNDTDRGMKKTKNCSLER